MLRLQHTSKLSGEHYKPYGWILFPSKTPAQWDLRTQERPRGRTGSSQSLPRARASQRYPASGLRSHTMRASLRVDSVSFSVAAVTLVVAIAVEGLASPAPPESRQWDPKPPRPRSFRESSGTRVYLWLLEETSVGGRTSEKRRNQPHIDCRSGTYVSTETGGNLPFKNLLLVVLRGVEISAIISSWTRRHHCDPKILLCEVARSNPRATATGASWTPAKTPSSVLAMAGAFSINVSQVTLRPANSGGSQGLSGISMTSSVGGSNSLNPRPLRVPTCKWYLFV